MAPTRECNGWVAGRGKPQAAAVDYDHGNNLHTVAGAGIALPLLLGDFRPQSVLDVGCGTGTWLRAALDLGIADVCGIDGAQLPAEALHVPADRIRICDLQAEWGLDRRFELVLCLEVAEHLPPESAAAFIGKLTDCGDRIFFSAANPWQPGQHHVNCQWPAYWQALFNRRGFVCRDVLRWKIWNESPVEPWYRQNLFLAEKDEAAGKEPRIPGAIHPDYMRAACEHWRNERQGLLVVVASWLDRHLRRIFGMKPIE